ncbi:hypothetical protein [Cellulophaga sp. Z1A5H]|uniref:hypothetical protein n=1 Tax=Cellulophaga sp. Z1A5H TaxID=2687291 RepID=UPI0013FD3BBF|nr:hypothetical protein [Cellulophaga sp. Z1A5H]
MTQANNSPIPCPECSRIKYFEGLCYWCKNKKKRETYQSMSTTAIENTITTIINNISEIENYNDEFDDFISLLAYHDINTEHIAKAAFEKHIFYPPTLYRNASKEVINGLINILLNPDCTHANHILCCLATNGSDDVKNVFMALENKPLAWRKKLHVDPSVYAELGGWSFDNKENKTLLVHQDCFPLHKEDRKDDTVIVGKTRADTCPICSCKLIDILTIDGSDSRLSFLGIKGKIKLPICPNCASLSEKTIIRYTLNGDSTMEIMDSFENENYVSETDLNKIASNNLTLSRTKEPLYYACGNDDVCTIGGQADWVQDFQYEKCPDCNRKMKLLAALSWDQFYEDLEGTLYIEICTDCSIAAAFHQQI